jgi:hypothetical protein
MGLKSYPESPAPVAGIGKGNRRAIRDGLFSSSRIRQLLKNYAKTATMAKKKQSTIAMLNSPPF